MKTLHLDGNVKTGSKNKLISGIKYKQKGGHLKEFGELINGHYKRRPSYHHQADDKSYNTYTCDNIPEVRKCCVTSIH